MPSLNVVVQALTLASGLLVNFLFPALFGLDAYGEFLKALLATFVLHRLVDTMAEPLLGICNERTLFPTALAMNAIAGTFLTAATLVTGIGSVDLPLLAAMVCTSTVLLTLHRSRRLGAISLNLLVFCVSFLGLSYASRYDYLELGLRDIMLASNTLGAVFGLAQVALLRRWITRTTIDDAVPPNPFRLAPIALASSLMSNFLTTILVFILSATLPARDLAMFRVFQSIIQASSSIFPASLKAIFVSFHDQNAAARIRNVLTAAFWILLVFAVSAWAASFWLQRWADVTIGAAVAIPFFWAMCLERYIQAAGEASRYRKLNVGLFSIVLFASLAVRNLEQAIVFYTTAASLYCAALAWLERTSIPWQPIYAVCAVVSLGVGLTAFGIVPAVTPLIVLAVLGAAFFRPRASIIPILFGRL